MTDFHRTVGEIRMFLQSADRTNDPRLAALAREYATACTEANERLNRCSFFLRQGLRSEALHLAKAEPDLLDMAAVLDFPERPEWDELAPRYGWAKAPALAIDHASALNEAYGEEDPLQDLLRRHRRLALARAPLPKRLEVMRKIAQLDTNNPIWLEDIRRFEVARQETLEQEVRAAKAELNAGSLEAIVRELETEGWIAAPGEAHVNTAKEAREYVRRQLARRTLGELNEELRRAQAAENVTKGRELRERWLGLLDRAKLAPGDPLDGEAQAPLDWLRHYDRLDNEQRAYQEAVLDLRHVLDNSGNRAMLAQYEEAVLRFGRGLPKELHEVVKERYRELGRADRRRTHIILASLTVLIAMLGALLVWSSAAGKRQAAVELAASRIESLLETRKLKEARGVLDQLEKAYPESSQTEPCASAVNRLTAAEREEESRVTRFAQAIKAIQDAPLGEEATAPVAAARMLALSAAEKAEIDRAEATRKSVAERNRKQVDDALRSRIEALHTRLATAERLVTQLPKAAETRDSLAALQEQVKSVRDDAEKASAEPRAQALAWIAKLERIESALANGHERERLLEKMADAVRGFAAASDSNSFVETCQTYMVKFPNDPRSAAFREVLAERPVWDSLITWSFMTQSWRPPYANVDPKVAAERVRQLTEFRTKHPQCPEIAVNSYHNYLMAIARREVRGDNDATAPLRRVLASADFQNLWRVRTTDGKTYYATTKPEYKDDGCLFSALTGIQGGVDRVYLLKAAIESEGPAPQSRLANRIKTVLARVVATPTAWDSGMIEILQAIQADPETDSIPRLLLLKAAIQTASLGSESLAEALREQAGAIQEVIIPPNLRWTAPDGGGVSAVRAHASQLLRNLPPIAAAAKDAEAAASQLEAAVSRSYSPIGVLLKDSLTGIWQCSAADQYPPGTELFVNSSDGLWEPIGKVVGGEKGIVIHAPTIKMLEGRLVFVRRGKS